MKKLLILLVVIGFVSCTQTSPNKSEIIRKQLDSIYRADSIEKINRERQRVADSIATIIELKLNKL